MTEIVPPTLLWIFTPQATQLSLCPAYTCLIKPCKEKKLQNDTSITNDIGWKDMFKTSSTKKLETKQFETNSSTKSCLCQTFGDSLRHIFHTYIYIYSQLCSQISCSQKTGENSSMSSTLLLDSLLLHVFMVTAFKALKNKGKGCQYSK